MFRLSVVGLLILLVLAVPLNKPASSTQNAPEQFVQKVIPLNISFREESAVHGVTEDGCEFSSTGWEASDGVVVFLKIYYCKPTNAQTAWNKLINQATKVFERKTIIKGATQTSERIVVSLSKEAKNPEMILWTDGNDIYMVESQSFEHALVFEKKYPNV